MALTSDSIERCLELLMGLVRADPTLAAEFEASIPDFFRGPVPSRGGALGALLAGRRHLEWFLLEHHGPRLGGASVGPNLEVEFRAAALERAEAAEDPELEEMLVGAFDALLRSQTGIFEVEEVRPEAGVWLRDVTGFGSFAAASVALAAELGGGELLVGRLYPAGEGVHVPSPAAAIVRLPEVVEALQRDLERIRDGQAAKVLRVSQGELEAMFFGAGGGEVRVPDGPEDHALPGPSGDPVADAVQLLHDAGFEVERARLAVQRLGREPRDPERLVHGSGDVLGRILEEVAFDTSIDLDGARKALMGAWELVSAAASGPVVPRGASPEALDEDAARAAAVDAFAAGRLRGEDPATLVQSLQRELGVGGEEQEPDQPAPDFPGVVGAMIDEMRWELGATRPGFDVEGLQPLDHLAAFARPIGVFEELTGDDLLRFATFWLQEKRALSSDDEARRLVGGLREFCEWSLDAHEVDLGSTVLDALDGLEDSLARSRRANLVLGPSSMDEDDPGEVYAIEALDERSAGSFEESKDRLRSPGGDTISVILPDRLRGELRVGDRLRARIAITGHADVRCCYPPEQAALGG
ncbi:MAG: hypothetical protein VX460_13880 [Planctomycetota bacterium]|nr:hypothetical protein [Planctomycetota bacterium]